MLLKVKEAEKITREEEATREAAESARSALEFAKHYVANAKKLVKEEALAKKKMENDDVIKEIKIELKEEKAVKTALTPKPVSKTRDLSKIDVIAAALSKLEEHIIPGTIEEPMAPATVETEIEEDISAP